MTTLKTCGAILAMLLASAVLQRVDAGHEHLDRAVAIPAKPSLVNYSPLTEEHAGGEMTVFALCHAILTRSDNTAANLLLTTLGGPDSITRFARSIGDTVTRLDRTETTLNEALPGDPRDTTSPTAMVGNLRTLLLGPAHGHAIAKAIEFKSDDVLQVEQGSLYPALHRLIKRGWISFDEGTSENNRRAKFYRLTPKGRRQLATETSKWDKLAAAIARILRPAE